MKTKHLINARAVHARFAWWALSCLLAIQLQAAELLRNGDFSDTFTAWKTSDATGTWNAYVYDVTSGGYINLHPPGSYTGSLLRQSLNVTGIANQTVTLSAKLRKTSAPSGSTISFRLQYVSTGNQVREVEVLNPANDGIGDWTLVSGNYTFPGDARKLTALVVYKGDYGDFDGDDFSLTASGVTVGTIPFLSGCSPSAGNYGSTITIYGSGFGNANEMLQLQGTSSGLNIQSWADTQITATVQEPARSGKMALFKDYVEADGTANFDVTSPNFTVDAIGGPFRVIKGATLNIPVKIGLWHGFTTTNGITFLLPEAPSAAAFAPVNMKTAGGVLLTLDTSGLPPGKQTLQVQTMEEHAYARFASLELEVVTVADIKFALMGTEITSGTLAINAQGELNGLGFTLYDANGKALDATAVTINSSNPTLFQPFKDNMGYWRYLALDNGSVTLTVTAPDGFSKNLTVNISVPNAPKVLSAGLMYSTLSNKGDVTNYFSATATDPVGMGWQNLTVRDQDTEWTANSTQATTTFRLKEGEMPGMYLFNAYTYSGTWETGYTETSKRFAVLTVENDPARGMISGRIADLNSSASAHMMNGNLELYDANSQALIKQQLIYLFGEPKYVFPYVAPGNYKLRFVPGDSRKAAQWYPNATSFAHAATVTVTAGQNVNGINFFNNTIDLREAIDFDTPDIFTSGFKILSTDTGWYGQRAFTHDNADALQTPMLQDDGSSFVEGTIEGPGTLSFWWKVSSETNADVMSFTLNWDMAKQMTISGEVEWTLVTIELPAGPNTVSWQYAKNSSGSGGMDAAWLDQVSFTPATVTTAPGIQVQPQSRTAIVGENAQFTVTATGTGPLYYFWKKDGELIPTATTETLSLQNVQVGDAATYTVVVSNSVGVANSDPATLTVYVPPSITTALTNRTVSSNRSVTFHVVATGTGPLTYQWQLNGNTIGGATTDTLDVTPTGNAKAGLYRVAVSGPGGVAESYADLTVVDLQMFTGSQAGLIISGASGNQYQIEYASSLDTPVTWSVLKSFTLSSSPQTVLDENSPGQPRRFYRVILSK